VAWFAAYVTMTEWLSVFAYHTDIAPGAFFTATAVVLAVALLTVTLQSLKSARMRPVRSLRNE
jgi:putative ABC transport system permease protein